MHLEADRLARLEHERTVEEHVRRTPASATSARSVGRDDRAARRERVRRRARRRRHDEPVGRVGGEGAAVDRDRRGARCGPAASSPTTASLSASSSRSRARPTGRRPRPRASCAPRCRSRRRGTARAPRGARAGSDLGEVAEVAEVHAEDRHARRPQTRSTVRSIVPSPPRLTARSRPTRELVGIARPLVEARPDRRPASAPAPRGRASAAATSARPRSPRRSSCTTRATVAVRARGRRWPSARPRSPTDDGVEVDRRSRRRAAGARVDEELDVAVGPPEGRDHGLHHGGSLGHGGRQRPPRAPAATPSGSRITPRPRDASARPASNCGFTRSDQVGAGRRQREQGRAAPCRREMNERSASRSGTAGRRGRRASRCRTLVRSRTDTRGSARRRSCSWP